MKRLRASSTRSTGLIAQQSSADPSVTLFKLEDPPDNEHEPVPGPSRRSKKRIKTTEPLLVAGGNDEALLLPVQNKTTRAQSTSSSPKKAKAIKRALDTPHPAPARWRETYDAIREMRARFPAPVDTMGCDTAKWKEMDPRVSSSICALSSAAEMFGGTEQALRDARIAHAVVADQRRSHGRCGRQPPRGVRRHAQS